MPRVAVLALLPLLLSACAGEDGGSNAGGSQTPSPPAAQATTPAEPECADLTGEAAAQIRMLDFSFDPFCAIVSSDQRIEFVNEGNNRHNFTVPKLDLDVLSEESKATESIGQFLKPGKTHAYTCKYHPGMNGELRVE